MGIISGSAQKSRVPNPPINLPQIKPLHLSLPNLSNDSRWPPPHHRKAWNHHIRRHNRTVQNPHIVFYNREFAHHDIGAYMDVRSEKRCFDDRARADEDMVGDLEGVVGECTIQTSASKQICWQETMRTLYTASPAASTHNHD